MNGNAENKSSSSISSNTSAALNRKLTKIIETRTDAPELQQSLETLAAFYGKNSLSSRRNLRGQIERRGIEINNQFLQLLLEVHKNLEEVQRDVSEMKNSCEEMSERLQYTKEISGKLMSQAEVLNDQRKTNGIFAEITDRFTTRFLLSEEELNALKSNDLHASFFASLQRVQQIHNDCKLLLRTQHQRAGLEIMDAMSLHEEAAYRKLYKWVRNECRKFSVSYPYPNDNSSLDIANNISPIFKVAIAALKNKPVLLGYCLDEIASTRNKSIVKSFLIALTQGGVNSVPRPIELHAHDPLRYIGDMLAWIHQQLANEYDLLHSILVTPSTTNQNATNDSLQMNTNEVEIKKVIDTVFEGVCRPFKVRVEQVIISLSNQYSYSNDQFNYRSSNTGTTKAGLVIIYRISNILDFYAKTISKFLPSSAALLSTLDECKQESLRVFFDLLKDQGDKLQKSPPSVPTNLIPPPEINEFIYRLRDIGNIFESSLTPNHEREKEFKPVLIAILDPLLLSCNLIASSLSAAHMSVFMINCLSSIQEVLALHDFTKTRLEMITAHIKAHMDTLIAEQGTSILQNCSLADKLPLLQKSFPKAKENEEGMVLSSILDKKTVSEIVQSLERLLVADNGMLYMPQCELLMNSQLRSAVRSSVNQVVFEAYSAFYMAITDPKNMYSEPDSYFLYKPDQVKTMLSLN